jgi:hypothetical protein
VRNILLRSVLREYVHEDFAAPIERLVEPAGSPGRLLQLYREIGLVAIAAELNLEFEEIAAAFDHAMDAGRRELAA